MINRDVNGQTVYVHNPLIHIGQGVAESQRVGDKLRNVRLSLTVEYSHLGLQSGTTRMWESSRLRVVVFKSPKEFTGSHDNWQSSSMFDDLFEDGTKKDITPVNTSRYIVIKQFWLQGQYSWDVSGTYGLSKFRTIHIPLAKEYQYLGGNMTYCKHNNIYVAIVAGPGGYPSSSSDAIGFIRSHMKVEYKDA